MTDLIELPLDVIQLVDEKLAGLVLLAGVHHALALQHDEALAVDRPLQFWFGQQSGQVRHGLVILLHRIQAEGQTPSRQIRFRMRSVLLQETFILLDGNRIEFPIVGGVCDKVLLQQRIVRSLQGYGCGIHRGKGQKKAGYHFENSDGHDRKNLSSKPLKNRLRLGDFLGSLNSGRR